MEPWDGPASIALTDGIRIGATLGRNGSERRVVGGDVAPAQEPHPFLLREACPDLLAAAAVLRVPGQEDEPRPVASRLPQANTDTLALFEQEPVRHLHQDPGPVAGVLLAAASPAVLPGPSPRSPPTKTKQLC
jgi:hypothetical protein